MPVTTNPTPIPMWGVYNDHWSNHPAGLPVSQYKAGTNPNQGTALTPAAWFQQSGTPAATTTPVTTPAATSATPTSASGVGATPNPGAGMTPTTGFAGRYTPAMMQQAYENPWYILNDVFKGIGTSSPMYQQLRDIGGDPLTLYNISQGGQKKIDGGAQEFVNWLANVYQQQGTSGGQGFDARNMLGTLFAQQNFGADAKNTLGQILGAGDMSNQVRTLYNMARDVSNVGMNPLAARGYQSALAQAGDRYGAAQMSASAGNSMNPAQWIAQNMPYLAMK